MAKKKRFEQVTGKEQDKTAELSITEMRTELLNGGNTGEKAELVNNPRRRTSVQKKASYAPEANAVSRKASIPNKPAIGNRVENSVPVQTDEKTLAHSNNMGSQGNSFNKNTLAIAALSLSCFLVIFVLFFCIIPIKQMSYEVPIVYQDIETYTEMEPYLDTVYYTEKEPYTVTEAYVVSEPYITTEPYIVYNQPFVPPFPHPRPPSDNRTAPRPLPPLPPQPVISYREVTRYADVTKYRDVIQYKDVQKSKNEIKFRPVQKQRTVAKVKIETKYKMVPLLYYLMV